MDYAQMLAQYRAQRSPPAAAMGGTVDYAQLLAERRAQRQAQAVNEYNPAAGMSVIEKGLVGLGRGFTDAIEGAKQAGLLIWYRAAKRYTPLSTGMGRIWSKHHES